VLRCMDCGLPYSEFPLDVVVEDGVWTKLVGHPGGVLCAQCLVTRGAELPGVTVAKLVFE